MRPVLCAVGMVCSLVGGGCGTVEGLAKSAAGSFGGACSGPDASSRCGALCQVGVTNCGDGLYCREDGVCASDCNAARGVACADNTACGANGRCAGSLELTSGSAAPGDGALCPEVQLDSSLVTPYVTVLVDGSGSMKYNLTDGQTAADFATGSRAMITRNALVGPSGTIPALQSQILFGFAIFQAPENPPDPSRECLKMTTVAPALNNLGAISAGYPTDLAGIADGRTPTAAAVHTIVNGRTASNALDNVKGILQTGNPEGGPSVLLLATDGEPTADCDSVSGNAAARTVAEIQAAYSKAIPTYVLGIGKQSDTVIQRLQSFANAGAGVADGAAMQAPYWLAGTDPQGVTDALRTIISHVLSCTLKLSGTVQPARACEGSVTLMTEASPMGEVLTCNGPDGWRLKDASTLEIVGAACTRLTTAVAPQVKATFPCGSAAVSF